MKEGETRALTRLRDAVINGHCNKSSILTAEALEEGSKPEAIVLAIHKSMREVGSRLESGEFFLPDVLCSAETAERVLDVVVPELEKWSVLDKARIVVGTVQGDIHDIGKNILVSVLRSAGYDVSDLGTNVSAQQFTVELSERKADFLLLSALTTTTMLYMREVVEALKQNGLRDSVRVIIGGGPVNEGFARHIGADHYGKDAFEALEKIGSLATKT